MNEKKEFFYFQTEDILVIIAAFILFLMLGLSWFFNGNTVHKDATVVVKIHRGMTFKEIIDSLHFKKIIDSKFSFFMAGKILGVEKKLKAGYYNFQYGKTNYDYLKMMVTGSNRVIVKLTVYEGETLKETAKRLENLFYFSADDFLKVAYDKDLLKKYEVDHDSFEGYLMADTYEFYELEDPAVVLETMATLFKDFYDNNIKPKEKELDLTKNQIITLASIIEGETNLQSEMPTIAGVYINRLKIGMKLQADPTVAYLLEDGPRRLLYKDLMIKSPYNTYLNYGLPPGPINFPSRAAILAAVNPEKHNYLFFVMKSEGEGHIFSRTYSEHLRQVEKYRQSLKRK